MNQDNEQQRNANNYETVTDQKPNSGRKSHDDGDYSYAVVNQPKKNSLDGTIQNTAYESPTGTATQGSPGGSTEGLKQQSLSTPGSSGYREKAPGTNGEFKVLFIKRKMYSDV